jgi:hypothetical protein
MPMAIELPKHLENYGQVSIFGFSQQILIIQGFIPNLW